MAEYQCLLLDPSRRLSPYDDAEVLCETDDLGEACVFIYHHWERHQLDICVYQPRYQYIRGYYRRQARDELGRFCRR